ncbi:MAG: rubrerythrin family protein [Halobacteriaceae archaeon]
MDGDAFLDRIEADNRTELSRLGSSKSLYADTGGEMETEAVLAATADAEYHARQTFARWADDEDDDDAAAVFDDAAADEADHYEQVVATIDGDHDPAADPPPVHAYLRDLDGAVERLGGFVGRTLASDASKGQTVGFFTGQADPGTASLFRDLRADLDDQLAGALDALESVCADEADWDRAREAADGAIQAAYEAYVDRLESMGVNPKPVC